MFMIIVSVSAALAYTRSGGDLSSIIPSRTSSLRKKKQEDSQSSGVMEQEPIEYSEAEEAPAVGDHQELQRFPDYPGWLWDPASEEWVADPEYDHSDQ